MAIKYTFESIIFSKSLGCFQPLMFLTTHPVTRNCQSALTQESSAERLSQLAYTLPISLSYIQPPCISSCFYYSSRPITCVHPSSRPRISVHMENILLCWRKFKVSKWSFFAHKFFAFLSEWDAFHHFFQSVFSTFYIVSGSSYHDCLAYCEQV